jgi:hypothetical protein
MQYVPPYAMDPVAIDANMSDVTSTQITNAMDSGAGGTEANPDGMHNT